MVRGVVKRCMRLLWINNQHAQVLVRERRDFYDKMSYIYTCVCVCQEIKSVREKQIYLTNKIKGSLFLGTKKNHKTINITGY